MNKFPAIICAAAFIMGIVFDDYIPFSFTHLVILFTVCIFLLPFYIRYKTPLLKIAASLSICLLLMMSGSLAILSEKESITLIPAEIIKENSLQAAGIIEKVNLQEENRISYLIKTDSFALEGALYKGEIKLIGRFISDDKKILDSVYEKIQPGCRIIQTGSFTKGKEKRNPGEYDYSLALRRNGISGILSSYYPEELKITDENGDRLSTFLFTIRKSIDKKISELHSAEAAALLRGLILADRSGIEFETKEAFVNAGIIHVLAVSGLHTGYIALIFLLLFGRFNIYLRAVLTIAGLLIFLFITGIPVSVFRAVVMSIVLILTFVLNRSSNIYNSLAVAAFIILIIKPSELFNPGFQLSFAAVLSIAVIYPIFQNLIINKIPDKLFLRPFVLFTAVSAAAQIGTMPITIYYFNKLSLVSIGANIIVIPLVGIIIAVAITTLLLSGFTVPGASIYASANEFFADIMFRFTELAGTSEISFIRVNDFSMFDIFIFYAAIVSSLYVITRYRLRSSIVIILFIVFNSFLLCSLDNKELLPSGKLSLLMIDVGQGDAMLIKFPDETTLLVDAGEAAKLYDNGERVIVPLLDYLNIPSIDYAFITHLDLDHYGGIISVLSQKRIKHLLKPPPDLSAADQKLEIFLRKIGQSYSYYSKEIFTFGNAQVYSLNNPFENSFSNANDRSGVLKILFGNTSFLLTGDIQETGERFYTSRYTTFLDSDVIKISHHGSNSSTSKEFINFVSQDFALISAGYKNRFNHPSPEVLDRLKAAGSNILRTDIEGAVLLQSDGYKIKVVNWKDS